MRINLKLHSKSILIKSLIGNTLLPFKNLSYSKEELIVVNYHSTPKKFIINFEHQLKLFKELFDIINPNQLEDYFEGKLNSGKPKLMYTFDDGLKNNLYAAEILKNHNIGAFYFLVPDFIETEKSKQKDFYLKNIRPIVNKEIDSEPEDFEALNWEEIKRLINNGNSIGSHTQTHTIIGGKFSEEVIKKEIIGSKQHIEQKIGIKINAFCSINNTLLSVGKSEKKLIKENYTFHFTTLPGYNSISKSTQFIKRRNIECFWPDGAVYFALGKSDLSRWQKKIVAYNQL